MPLVYFVTRPVFVATLGLNCQPAFDLNYVRYLVTGLIIVLVLLFRPKGLLAERPVDTVAMRVAQRWKTPATVDEPERDDSEISSPAFGLRERAIAGDAPNVEKSSVALIIAIA